MQSKSTRVFLSHRGLNKQGYKCRRECFIDPPLSFPVGRLVELLRGKICCLFTQNATRQSTSGASKKSLASAPDRRPTVATPWWAKVNVWGSTLDVPFICYSWKSLSDWLSQSGTLSRQQRKPHGDNLSADKMALVDDCADVCSSRKSASRLTCRIASRLTTTRVPPSATTAAACCGASTGKASSAKVGSHLFYY